MNLYGSSIYIDDIKKIAELDYAWDKLKGKNLAISGATGMIGSFLVDVLMYRNEYYNQDVTVYAFGRNEEKAKNRFGIYFDNGNFKFVKHDINTPIEEKICGNRVDYIVHAASNTHPVAYASDPIGTISANVIGTNNLLDWADKVSCERFVFISSVEIYGENKGDTDKFAEDYLGYIDCNTLRAGYPESKRAGETMCQAYIKQKELDVVIPRLSRCYGPTMLDSDTKALSQFILKGVHNEDIVLKSEGIQEYSYAYMADAVSGILKIMFDGECGQAYNVVSDNSDIMLKDLAKIIADYTGGKVIFEFPDETEKAGYSTATKATLASDKLKETGWKSYFDIKTGLHHTIEVLRSYYEYKC
ncbi:MAG: NAD-dependent epimerase/dehydratase family protein [Lachnospiraceae bacterium]|nr:NAD-dependent epimerase/dehydratase family protein [Lachnospiraceae bacterium]